MNIKHVFVLSETLEILNDIYYISGVCVSVECVCVCCVTIV